MYVITKPFYLNQLQHQCFTIVFLKLDNVMHRATTISREEFESILFKNFCDFRSYFELQNNIWTDELYMYQTPLSNLQLIIESFCNFIPAGVFCRMQNAERAI